MSFELAALCGCAFLAGFIDAVAGGGGLIQIPALMVLLPNVPIATLFGTNKCVSIWGTATATWQYLRHVKLPWRAVLPTTVAALVCGYLGAAAVSAFDPELLRPVVLTVLALVLAYTLWRKDFGSLHAPHLGPATQVMAGLVVGGLIGFYDGFFGPGTGSFLVLAFVAVFGFSFLHASASAKIVNVVTNLAAIGYFVPHGQVLWKFVLPMALCNVAGGLIGAHTAIRRGSGFVRLIFLVVVGALMLRIAYGVFLPG
ncbi:MAG: sulfite exporter TauE/SafE family protein [Panacagrimonas sp.]